MSGGEKAGKAEKAPGDRLVLVGTLIEAAVEEDNVEQGYIVLEMERGGEVRLPMPLADARRLAGEGLYRDVAIEVLGVVVGEET